jgi:hypothetical protein
MRNVKQLVDEAYAELALLPPQERIEISRGVGLRFKANGIPVVSIHYSADPKRDPETEEGMRWYTEAKKTYSSEGAWAREQEMDDNAGGGELLLAPTLQKYRDSIIISDPDWMPDPRWDCVEGFDHGKTNATCLLKAYIDFEGCIYLCGEYYNYRREFKPGIEPWANEIWQNVDMLNGLHSIGKPRWCMADPSLFYDKEAQKDGTFAEINDVYRKQGVKFLSKYEGERSDLTLVSRIMERWARLDEFQPMLKIVCRNYTAKRQPGLHPFDCPNLLWELYRVKRAELSDRQLMTRNPVESIIDKDNHARDAFKYLLMMLPRPTAVPLIEQFENMIAGVEQKIGQELNPMSYQVAAQRFITVNQSKMNGRRSTSVPMKRTPQRPAINRRPLR